MFLEDFEDGSVNTPFVDEESSGGRTTIGVTQFLTGENNSVDGDDGLLDGAALLGVGWTGAVRGATRMGFVFTPRTGPDGRPQFPTYFGFAITAGIGGDSVTASFTDEEENFLGTFTIHSWDLPEYAAGLRGVVTDRFLAMYIPTGAEIMNINGGIYTIDHLTYGWDPIPEPGTAALAAVAGLFWLHRRRPTFVKKCLPIPSQILRDPVVPCRCPADANVMRLSQSQCQPHPQSAGG